MWLGYSVTSSTLLADPLSNETIDVFHIKTMGSSEDPSLVNNVDELGLVY